MYSLLAFKVLAHRGDKVQSPCYRVDWAEHDGAYHLQAHPGDLDIGRGVFAAGYGTARGYLGREDRRMYLVAPEEPVVEGTGGWRAQGAFTLGEVEDLKETARYILAARMPVIPKSGGSSAGPKESLRTEVPGRTPGT